MSLQIHPQINRRHNAESKKRGHSDAFGMKPSVKYKSRQNCSVTARSQGSGDRAKFGRDWGQEEKGTTEDEMAGWHH